jgi:hypothetical protein
VKESDIGIDKIVTPFEELIQASFMRIQIYDFVAQHSYSSTLLNDEMLFRKPETIRRQCKGSSSD